MSELELDFDNGMHACHLYGSSSELKGVTLPFVRDGLLAGECLLYITNEESIDDWLLEFQAFGIDVKKEMRTGRLNVVTTREWRRPGERNSINRARKVLQLISSKLAEFSALRIAGDPEWELDEAIASADLCHWEATANLVFDGLPVRTICQYNLNAYSTAAIHAALRTHPVLVYAGRAYSNPLYEAPRILENEPHLNHCSTDPLIVDEVLSGLLVTT